DVRLAGQAAARAGVGDDAVAPGQRAVGDGAVALAVEGRQRGAEDQAVPGTGVGCLMRVHGGIVGGGSTPAGAPGSRRSRGHATIAGWIPTTTSAPGDRKSVV